MIEKELVIKCKREDRLAQKELYDRYYAEMKRLVMRYINDQDDAFDCLSKGFYNALIKIDQFNYRGEGSLSAWIRRIMINESLSKIKASKKELCLVESDTDEMNEISYEDVDVSLIYACIKELPDRARAIFNLVAIEGFSHKEAAQQLDITESTSRSQLVYARNKMKDLLKRNEL